MVPQRTKSSSRKREAAAQIKGPLLKKSNIEISSTLGHVHGIDKNNMDHAMGKNTDPPFLGSVSQRKHSHDTAEIRENIKNFFGLNLSVTTCDPKIGINESKGGQRGDSQNCGPHNFPPLNDLGVPINYMGHLMTEKSLLEETRLLQNMYLASSNYLLYLIRSERTPHQNHPNSSTEDLLFSEQEPQSKGSSPIQELYPDSDKHSDHEEEDEEHEKDENDEEDQNDESDQNEEKQEKIPEGEENERPVSPPEPRRLRSRNLRESVSTSVSSKSRSSEPKESLPDSPRKTRGINSEIPNREIPSDSDMDDETHGARSRSRKTRNRKRVNEDQNEEVSIRAFALLRGNTPAPSSPKENSEPKSVETLQNLATEPGPLPKLKRYQCPVCRKISVNKKAFLRHSKIHTRDSSIECNICHKKFASEEMLGSHIQRHTGEKPFGCPYCEKCFTVKHHLKFHLRKHRSW